MEKPQQTIAENVALAIHNIIVGEDIILDDLGEFTNVCQIIRSQVNGKPEAIRRNLLKSVRRMPKNKKLDSILKEYYDTSSIVEEDTEDKNDDPKQDPPTVEVIPDENDYPLLPEGIIPDITIEGGIVDLRKTYRAYSEENSPEAFEDFHELCFWWALSTIAARRIRFLLKSAKSQYTSLYLAMVARSSAYAKTETAGVAIEVIRKLNLDFLLIPDRITPARLLSNMGARFIDTAPYENMSEDEQYRFRLRIAMSGQRGWVHDEFGKFISGMVGQSSISADFASILLSFESSPKFYENETIQRGAEPIENVHLSLLGCATPSNFRENGRKGPNLWLDGTYARFGFICPPRGTGIDKPFALGESRTPTLLLNGLRNWSDRLGYPEIDLQPRENKQGDIEGHDILKLKPLPEHTLDFDPNAYELWTRYRSATKALVRDDESETFDSSYQRLCIRVLRLAALAASYENAPEIEVRHMVIALQFSEKLRISGHRLYNQTASSYANPSSMPENKILKLLDQKEKPLTAREIAQYTNKDAQETAKRLNMLEREGEIKSEKIGRTIKYFLVRESKKSSDLS